MDIIQVIMLTILLHVIIHILTSISHIHMYVFNCLWFIHHKNSNKIHQKHTLWLDGVNNHIE